MESLFLLCQPWLPERKHVPSLLCTKKGFTGKDIAPSKFAPKSTIYRLKNFKESSSIVVKKASGRPRKSSQRQDRLLKLIQLRDQGTTSTEFAQEWQQAGVSASARTVRAFGGWPVVKKGSKEATSLQEKHQGQTDIQQKLQGLDC